MARLVILMAVALVSLIGTKTASAQARLTVETDAAKIDRICTLIEASANEARIPPAFFARLIWKESRFDARAVSPVGAQGIAQFMPTTAALRKLDDPFDIEQALPASALYLADLRDRFGNLGLAAAAYNAGETRVANWLSNGGFLPLETENFVAAITGDPADVFTDPARGIRNLPVEPDRSFAEGCRRLPIVPTRAPAMAEAPRLPWAVQVAGNFRRSAAEQAWNRVRQANRTILEGRPVGISQVRSAMGRRSIFAVRVGAESRREAERICTLLRSRGGSCIVMKN